MSRTVFNYWLDMLLLFLFLVLVWASVVVRFVFPSAVNADGWTLWGWTYDEWSDFRFATLALLALGVLLHLMMHWSWICGVTVTRIARSKSGKKRPLSEGEETLYGVAVLVIVVNLLGLGIAAAVLMVHAP